MSYWDLSETARRRWVMAVIAAKAWPAERQFYCQEAMNEQANQVMYLAQEWAGARK